MAAVEAVSDYNDSGDELEPSNGGRAIMRAAAVAVAVVGFVAVAACSALFKSSSQSVDKLDGFINKLEITSHAPVASWIKPKPDLCNLGIVLDFCLRINGESPAHLNGNPKSPKAVVSASTLADILSVSASSVTDFLQKVGAVNVRGDDYTVSCAQLCQKTVGSFSSGELPGMVDIGCFYKEGMAPSSDPCMPTASLMMPVCDVDVSMPVLAKTELPMGTPYQVWEAVGTSHTLPDAPSEQVKFAIARLFRIFPGSKTAYSAIEGEGSILPDSAPDSVLSAQRKLAEPLPTDSCFYSQDDVCDEPMYCLRGTDCSDCGTCQSEVPVLNAEKPERGRYGDELLQSGAKAQSLLAWALMALQAGKGPYDPASRASLKKKIAAAAAALDDITYTYPAVAECKEPAGAYMDGKVMYLCDSFFDRPLTGLYLGILETIMGDLVNDVASFVTTNL